MTALTTSASCKPPLSGKIIITSVQQHIGDTLLNVFRLLFYSYRLLGRALQQEVPAVIGTDLTRPALFSLCVTQYFIFWQDVQLHGRWVVLCRSREHTPHCLHGN